MRIFLTVASLFCFGIIVAVLTFAVYLGTALATSVPISIDNFQARPPIHTFMGGTAVPSGLIPADVKSAYHLPLIGGSGTIAIISAFHHANVENDLAVFDSKFNLQACSIKNKCLEIHSMTSSVHIDSGWDMETALDTEWSHAIAPQAKILVVEAASDRGQDLLKALDYATSRKDAVSVSMSWGGPEFSTEASLDRHFSTTTNAKRAFFASSGDDGAGTSWPAASSKVVSVGGTRLVISRATSKSGNVTYSLQSESAWSGSGGGVSQYERQPSFQSEYSIPRAGGMRAIPDVSYAADPTHGFSVYHSTGASKSSDDRGWYVVGGTSAGAPQWAAIHALGKDVSLDTLYRDKAATNTSNYFRDIISGKNGSCVYFCTARKHYDYVTGLGSPLTYKF